MKVNDVIQMVEKRGMHFAVVEKRLHIRGKTVNMSDKLRALVMAMQPQIYAHYGLEYDDPNGVCPLCGGRIPE